METFEYTVSVRVVMSGKYVGDIRQVDLGWQYFPKNCKTGGEIFPNVQEAKKSLEEL